MIKQKKYRLSNLFNKRVSRGCEAVTLAIDCWIITPTNNINLPIPKIIVNYMHIPSSTPRHPLHYSLSKHIKRQCHLFLPHTNCNHIVSLMQCNIKKKHGLNIQLSIYLHSLIQDMAITVTKQHNIIMMRKMTVRNGKSGGPHSSINQPISTRR